VPESLRGLGAQRGDGVLRGVPPRLRRLFGPQRMRVVHAQAGAGGGDDAGVVVGEDELHFGSAEVDAQIAQIIFLCLR
jgi:hypothetical protein